MKTHVFSPNDLQSFMNLPPDERDKLLYIYVKEINDNIKMIKYMLSIIMATTIPIAVAVITKLII